MELFDPILTDSQPSKNGVHSLQRTNVRLSGNIKYVYDNDALYLESINSSSYLASSRFKGHKINLSATLPQAVSTFMQNSSELTEWYKVKNANLDQSNQPHEQRSYMYEWGAYFDTTTPLNKNKFFAPLWTYGELPDMFCIFRLDNTNLKNTDIKEILKSGKLIKAVDLRKGENKHFDWMRTYLNDRNFRYDALKANFADKKISYYGFSAENSNWMWKDESILEDYSANERMIIESNNTYTNGFWRNNLIHPAILNLEFTFEDKGANYGWSQYVGFYLNVDDISSLDARMILQKNPEVLFISKNKNTFERTVEEKPPYLEVSNKITGFKSETLPSTAELEWLWMPSKNSHLTIKFNDMVVYDFTFGTYTNVKSAKKALLNDFKKAKLNQVSLRMYEIGDRFFIEAVNNSNVYERLKLEIPSSIRTPYGFKVVNDHDVIVTNFPKEDVISNEGTLYNIITRFKYKDFYVVRLDNPIKLNTVTNLELLSNIYPELFICSYISHKDFDFSIDRTNHYDPVDSDTDKNKKFLLDVINTPEFRGGWQPDIQTLEEYKNTLIGMINEHFDPIIIPKEFMIKDIDLVTLEASSTVPNEYLRLEESTNPNTKNLNRINPFISKWGHSRGRNTYSRPYELNISLAMRYDNFAPAFSNFNRDLRTHTHSWYIIGEGVPPYFDNVRKMLGYTSKPIDYLDLIDTDEDAYLNYLTHELHGNLETSWSDVFLRDGSQNVYYTFFRGAEIEFTGNYEGYRFSTILITREQVNNTVSVSDYVSIIDNTVFKTLTIIVRFFIPDPVLTSLEGEIDYYLDRSLLYFSNTVYSTRKLGSFGSDTISLDLYNDSINKKFNGIDVGKDWQYTDQISGKTYYYIRRGDIIKWTGNFKDLIESGDNFTWRTIRDDGSVIVEYEAFNVVEIQDDFIWCEDIKLTSHREPTSIIKRSLKEELENYVGEESLLTKDNEWYISKAIAYYNSVYDIVVTPRTNNKRYKAISFGAIANILNNYAINYNYVTNNDITNSTKRLKVYEADYITILNSIKSEDNQLIQMNDRQLMIPLYRHSGTYSPIFKTIFEASKLIDNDSLSSIQKVHSDIRYIKKWSTRELENQIDIEDRNYLLSPIYSKMLKLYKDETRFNIVNRYTNLNQMNSFISAVFNYSNEIELIATSRVFNLMNLSKNTLFDIVTDNDFSIGLVNRNVMLEILQSYVSNSTDISMLLEDVEDYLYMNFYLGTFMKLYTIDKIITYDDKIIQYNQKNTFEYEMESDIGRVIMKRL